MIWPSEAQFNVCFPYGPDVEEDRGKGRVLRLAITERQGKPEGKP